MMSSTLSTSGFFLQQCLGTVKRQFLSLVVYQKALTSNGYQSVLVFTVKAGKACSFVIQKKRHGLRESIWEGDLPLPPWACFDLTWCS